MPSTFSDRLAHAWNAFRNNDTGGGTTYTSIDLGYGSMIPSGQYYHYTGNERTIINSIYTRLAMDVAAIDIYEARIDSNGNPTERYKSGLSECLTTEANIDQTGRAFLQDVAMSLFTEGHAAIVPTDTSLDPAKSDSYTIQKLRVGRVKQWYPEYVTVDIYNERKGQHEEVTLPKKMVAIVQNPLYSVMNEPNSTLKRLLNKLNLLDIVDQQSSSGKLNMIVQLPYVVKSDARKAQAEQRRTDIEAQLTSSKYGIAYTDGTEKIQQLSRPIENNFLQQIEFLTNTLYDQLGLTKEILNGTANEQTMLNYYNHTVEPIAAAIADELTRKFITKTARTQGRRIVYMRDPFKLVPVNNIAEIADKFTRNEILSSNEIRCIIGFQPSDQEGADDLRNKNLYPDATQTPLSEVPDQGADSNQNESGNSEEPQGEPDWTEYQTSVQKNQDSFANFTADDYVELLDSVDNYEADLQALLSTVDNSLKHYGTGAYLGSKGDFVYSNKYYDPDYQHQYYVENKQKFHKKRGENADETGGAENGEVVEGAENPEAETEEITTQSASIYDDNVNQVETVKQNYINKAQQQMDALAAEIDSMDDDTLDENRESYIAKINALIANNNAYRADLNVAFKRYSNFILSEADNVRS